VGKLAEARSAADHTDPLDPRALALRGYIAKTLAQIAEARGDQPARQEYLEEAERFYSHALQLDPREPGAWNGLGNVRAMLGDHDAAIESYERAIELAPNYTAAYHDLAISCQAKMKADPDRWQQWHQRALRAWQKAYALAPMDPGFSERDVVTIGRKVRELKGVVNRGTVNNDGGAVLGGGPGSVGHDGLVYVTQDAGIMERGTVTGVTLEAVDTSGGTYIGGDAEAGGDLVGRDQVVHGDQIKTGDVGTMVINMGSTPEPDAPLVEEAIRLDVAHPPTAILGVPFDLAVAVQTPDAPALTVDDLTQVSSEGGSVFRHQDDEVVLYRIAVSAVGCEVEPPHYVLKLRPQASSQICWFQITAHRPGKRSIFVTAYQEDEALAAQTRLSIKVQVPITPDG
jgi:hypothetical protein